MRLSTGDKLGPYEILSPLGEGGMGEVWKARDTRLDRIVAIKQLNVQYIARFHQEARAIAALNHPHICQIYDVGPDYLVLEYVDGAPVKGPMALADAVRVALQITSALEAAHAKKILHRDLKPGNILISAAGAKLLDFGLAKLFEDVDATLTLGTCGTPLYMSPEQAEGKPLDVRSDVFSFGSVLYELLAGRRAFDSLAAVLRDDPQPLGAIPAGLQAIVARCLRKNPVDRFASVAELRAALEDLVAKRASRQPSIAVMPFANMSGDKEQEYFSDGLAEEIINALAHVPGLKVTARTSAFSFKGKDVKVAQIARELGVENILEGSVRKGGNRLRITAQLISAADGFHLWSERYDRELNDIFAIQDEIALAVVDALKVKLLGENLAEVLKRYTNNTEAYEAYLKGRFFWSKFTLRGFHKSIDYFNEAIAIDPKYALAFGGIADAYMMLSEFGGLPAREAMRYGKDAAQKALSLDEKLPEAHCALGFVLQDYDFDFKSAERGFLRALELNPNHALTYLYYAQHSALRGRHEVASPAFHKSLDLDPLSPIGNWLYGYGLFEAGKFDEALLQTQKAIEMDPGFPTTRLSLAGIFQMKGEHGRSVEAMAQFFELLGDAAGAGLVRDSFARSGWEGYLRAMATDQRSRDIAFLGPAVFYATLGETEAAIAALEEGYDSRALYVVGMNSDPRLNSLRSLPRFTALLGKIGFVD